MEGEATFSQASCSDNSCDCPETRILLFYMFLIKEIKFLIALNFQAAVYTTCCFKFQTLIPTVEGEILYDSLYMRNLKRNDTDELTYKTETGSDLENLWFQSGRRMGAKDS